MKKATALELLGGTVASAAEAIGISSAAISQWPDELPQRIVDRVQAAQWRIANGVPHPKASSNDGAPPVPAEAEKAGSLA
jgi:hypothetical protein